MPKPSEATQQVEKHNSRRRMYNDTANSYNQRRYGSAKAERYREDRNQVLRKILMEKFGDQQRLSILEVGCGTGLTLEYLSTIGAGYQLYGSDFSRTMLLQARDQTRNCPKPPRLFIGNAYHLPFEDNHFDVVYATRFMHQFPGAARRSIYQELQRVVRVGGLVVLEYYAYRYHWLRYHLSARKRHTYDEYFTHYPKPSELRSVIGESFKRRPIRVVGTNSMRRVLGDRLGTALSGTISALSDIPPMSVLVDEYFVATEKRN